MAPIHPPVLKPCPGRYDAVARARYESLSVASANDFSPPGAQGAKGMATERMMRDVQKAARVKRVQLAILRAGTESEIDAAFASRADEVIERTVAIRDRSGYRRRLPRRRPARTLSASDAPKAPRSMWGLRVG